MFVEQKGGANAPQEGRLETWARAHPGFFNVALAVLAVVTAAALLFQGGATFVLYQGF